VKKIILPIIILSSSSGLLHAQASTNENYVQSTTYIDYPAGQAAKKAVSVQYFDGLGRPKQTVSVQATPQGRDVVSHIVYDAFGRVASEYLPVPQGGTQNGAIYPDPLSNLTGTPYGNEKIYSEKLLESSPLDRVLEQKQPGTAWNDKPVKFEYGTNTGTEVKKYGVTTTWSYGATNSSIAAPVDYGANQLYKTTVTDEDGNATTEFKNTKGQVILVRKALSDTQNADTYYLYNEYDQLAAVIPPKAVPLNISQLTLDDLCYQYSYDGRNRLAGKKVPGKGWEYMVYDKQDRLVMTQDAELGKASQWLFTKYDAFGRPVYTGMYTGTQAYGPQGRAAEQANVETKGSNNESRGGSSPDASVASLNYNNAAYPASNIKILTINYYDTFPRDPYFPNDLPDTILNQKVIINSQSGNVKGLLLASYVKNIENDDWTRNFMLYDPKGRLIGSRSINHLGGSTHIDMKLNFAGLTEQSITRHKRLGTDTEKVITENFTYDHQNRPLVHKHKVDNNAEEILSQNKYNELSQLEQKKVGGINPGSPLQTIDYQYNIRGWMTGINDPANLGSDLFGYKIKYNQVEGMENPNNDFMELKVKPKYNGNIAEVDWKTATASNDYNRRYGYVYDKLNRMVAGFYQRDNNPSGKEFFEKLDYDLNGNIERLKRSSDASTGNPTTLYIDDLTYVNEGNRLKTVTDASTNYNGYPDASGNIIAYDLNGNMIDHKDKGILQIKYNYLSLPDHQTFDQTYLVRNVFGGATETRNITTKYLYAADGTKLKKTYTYGVSKNNSEAATVTDYLDGFQYEGQGIVTGIVPQILKFIPTSEGYYNFENNKYIYNYTDHLGNVRLSYMNSSTGLEVIEESNYYPFGLKHQGYNALAGNPAYQYQYNGKELQKESGMYDYGARFYMPDLGRWGVVDPLAEKMTRHSLYNYAFNNPIRFIDPDGMAPEGDYYTKFGRYLGNDGKNDGKVYVSDGIGKDKKGNAFFANAKEIDITQSKLEQKASTVYGESTAFKSEMGNELKKEMYSIASVHETNDTAYGNNSEQAESFRDTDKIDRNGTKMQIAVGAVINATTGGPDYSNGASQWDGKEQGQYNIDAAHTKMNNGAKIELHMNTMGWNISDAHYSKWRSAIGPSFKAPQVKAATTGMNQGKIRLNSTAVYNQTIFWKVTK